MTTCVEREDVRKKTWAEVPMTREIVGADIDNAG